MPPKLITNRTTDIVRLPAKGISSSENLFDEDLTEELQTLKICPLLPPTVSPEYPTHIDRSLWKARIKNRVTTFVIIPEIPKTRGGVQEKENTKELITLAEATISTLQKTEKGIVCPKVIFPISAPSDANEHDPVHQLRTYTSSMQQEKQFLCEFHIAAHGSPNMIGGLISENWLSPEDLAERLHDMFTFAQIPNEITHSKSKPLIFVFHSCNSAWCDIQHSMSLQTIQAKLLEESFIGRFTTRLNTLEYAHVKVSGYRGFYSHMNSHKASVVTSDAIACSKKTTLPAESAQFTIHTQAPEHKKTVTLPQSVKGTFFHVAVSQDPLLLKRIIHDQPVNTSNGDSLYCAWP